MQARRRQGRGWPARRVIAVLWAALALGACATTGSASEMRASGTNLAPGADGVIEVERLEDSALVRVEVHVSHLVPPNLVAQGLAAYVVWAQPQRGRAMKLANLEYSPPDRSGEAEALTFLTAFELMVTAEMAHDVMEPSQNVVLSRRVVLSRPPVQSPVRPPAPSE